jgi:hypothetical protein
MVKTRLDANITVETMHQVKRIIEEQSRKATREDLPPSSNSEIVEMILRKGIRTYNQENNAQPSPNIPNHP